MMTESRWAGIKESCVARCFSAEAPPWQSVKRRDRTPSTSWLRCAAPCCGWAAGVAVAAVAAMLIPAALGRSSEAVIKGALEEAEQRVAEPDLVG
jgi:hypothetical protein